MLNELDLFPPKICLKYLPLNIKQQTINMCFWLIYLYLLNSLQFFLYIVTWGTLSLQLWADLIIQWKHLHFPGESIHYIYVCVCVCAYISCCQDNMHHIKIHVIPLVSYQLSIFSVVIMERSDLRQVGGFLWILWIPPPIELTATI